MTTTLIRKKLTDYLQIADEKKIKAIYTMVEDDIDTMANDWDETFVKELNRRNKELERGAVKGYSWEETKQAAIKKVQSKKK